MTQLITDFTHVTVNSETLIDLLIIINIENFDFSEAATTFFQVTYATFEPVL